MRTVAGGEATLLTQAHVNHYVRVYVKNIDGTEKLLTSLGGTDWVDSVSWDGESVDRQIATATIQLRRDVQGGTSLAPLIEGSSLNVDDASAYAPLLGVGRAIRITTAVTDHAVAPVAGDWKEVFKGRIDDVDWESDPITVQCSDLGAWLMDAAIQEATQYGSDSGASLESIMQDILDDWPPFAGFPVTLYLLNSSGVATAIGGGGALSPTWTVPKAYWQQPMPVLEALNNLVAQIGWTLRYHYDTAGTFALTLYEPPRASTTSLATIGPSVYREVRKCAVALRDVRNSFALDYLDTSNAAQTRTTTDTASIATYGTRFMRLAGDAVANIRTSTDADAMLAAVQADLGAPKLDQSVSLLYYWPAQAYDLYTFTANNVHYSDDQLLAVMSVRHEARNGEIVTTLDTRGSVIGAFAEWLAKRVVSPISGDGSSLVLIPWAAITDTPTTLSGYGITDALPRAGGTMTGTITSALGTITASTPARSDTATWNSSGVTFVHELVNVTDTASASASLLLDRQVGGVSRFALRKDGASFWNAAEAFMAAVGAAGSAGAVNIYAAGSTINAFRAGGVVTTANLYGAAGTFASPTALTSGLGGQWRCGGFDSVGVAAGVLYRGLATETWSSTAHGMKAVIQVTPNGSTTNADALTLDQDKSATFGLWIKTAAPTGGSSGQWKIGTYKAATVALDTAHYVEVEIDGNAYKLAVVT